MIDTVDLDSYYPGYDEYCERFENQGGEEFEEDIDAIIDERRLQELEAKENQTKEVELFKVIFQENSDGKFNVITYNSTLLDKICKVDKSVYKGIKNTILQSFENIENKVKEEENAKGQ